MKTIPYKLKETETFIQEAETFIRVCYAELGRTEAETESRLAEIRRAIDENGYYEHTGEELRHGARMAWRNSSRCIGRLFWESLYVCDARHIETEAEAAEALLKHIETATNDGKIRPVITIFKPAHHEDRQLRIWNHQLIRYAGYETEDGILGDPASLAFTKLCRSLGWEGAGTPFDVLPLVLSVDGREPQFFDIPKRLVLEVPLEHPELPGFADMQLKWYGVPMVSDMRLEIGGISYTAAPFNGWYMGTEIGARNLADEDRYDMLPKVASLMGLDTSRESTLWRDKALVELNVAVLHSYKRDGVSIVDHHTAAQQFARFEDKERACGRPVSGEWTWLIPPVSPATTHVFHRNYTDTMATPNYYYQDKLYG